MGALHCFGCGTTCATTVGQVLLLGIACALCGSSLDAGPSLITTYRIRIHVVSTL